MERYKGNAEEIEEYAAFCASRQVMEKMGGTYGKPLRKKSVIQNIEPVLIEVGERKYLPYGYTVESKVVNPIKRLKAKKNTARHEALHAVVGEKTGSTVEKVSIVPNYDEGYEGITIFNEFNPAAAIAADEAGENGAGSDVKKVRYSGVSEGAARAVARNIITTNEEHIEAVGGLLVEKGTISGGEVRRIMRRVNRGDEVEVSIKKPNGDEQKEIITGIKGEIVMVERKWFEIPEPVSNVSPIRPGLSNSGLGLSIAA